MVPKQDDIIVGEGKRKEQKNDSGEENSAKHNGFMAEFVEEEQPITIILEVEGSQYLGE